MNIRVVLNAVSFCVCVCVCVCVTVRLLPSHEGVCLEDVRGSGKKLQRWWCHVGCPPVATENRWTDFYKIRYCWFFFLKCEVVFHFLLK